MLYLAREMCGPAGSSGPLGACYGNWVFTPPRRSTEAVASASARAARNRVDQGMEALRTGLYPYVEEQMRACFGPNWLKHVSRARGGPADAGLDAYALLKTLRDNWDALSRHDKKLRGARSFVEISRDARNDSAHFAGEMIERHALRYLDAMHELLARVGAEAEARTVECLYQQQRDAENNVLPNIVPSSQRAPTNRAMRGKYARLYHYLINMTAFRWPASFGEIETVLGFGLPASARRHQAWWANQSGGGHTHARAWQEAGWRTRNVNLQAETLVFERINDLPNA